MNLIHKIFALSTISSLMLISGCNNDKSPSQDESYKAVDITILHTNDHHSYLEGQTYDLKIDHDESAEGVEDIRLNLGGFSRIASAISEYRDTNTLVINSGELNGTLYFSLYKGEVDVKVFNYLNLDAYQLGNHEFDEGEARLAELIEMANFPIISGNVHPTADSPLYNSDIKPYVIKEIDDEKVAILGVLKVEKTRESSLVTNAVEFTDEITSVKAHVADLTEQGVNKIILLSHLGYDFDQVLATQVTGIDIIVGGDTHNALDSTGELAKLGVNVTGEYPSVVNNPNNEPVYIVQAWEYAKGLGKLNVSFDADGKVTEIGGHLELLVGQPYQVKNESGSWVDASVAKIADISKAISNVSSIREIEEDVDVPFAVIENVPVFPGCENDSDKRACFNKMMQEHISKNFRYPELAQEMGIQGRVSVMFTIQTDGSIGNVRMRSPDKNLEREATRIISKLPKMIPGRQRGRVVRVPYSIPITFKLR